VLLACEGRGESERRPSASERRNGRDPGELGRGRVRTLLLGPERDRCTTRAADGRRRSALARPTARGPALHCCRQRLYLVGKDRFVDVAEVFLGRERRRSGRREDVLGRRRARGERRRAQRRRPVNPAELARVNLKAESEWQSASLAPRSRRPFWSRTYLGDGLDVCLVHLILALAVGAGADPARATCAGQRRRRRRAPASHRWD
jgi:hypothetical protein